MYVTKLMKRDETVHRDNIKLYDKKCMIDSPPVSLTVERNAPEHNEYDIYSFGEMYHMLDACRQLTLCGYNGSSSIWVDDSIPRYYLAIEKTEKTQYSLLGEYGTKHPSPTAYTYIVEHCRCICEDRAVEKMAALV
jgi:negative regulator of genetic competence, sporulation and motility